MKIGPHFTVVLKTFNEEDVLPFIIQPLLECHNVIAIDAGSTDQTLNILREFGIRTHLIDFTQDRYQPTPSPNWYIDAFSLVSTPYILLVYCSHFYTRELLQEQEDLSADLVPDYIHIPYKHYMYRRLAPAFSTYNPFPLPRPFKRKTRTIACSFFFKKSSLDLSQSRIHYEFPVSNASGLSFRSVRKPLLVFRLELFQSIESKIAEYSSRESLLHANFSNLSLCFRILTVYPLSFFLYYFCRFAFLQGISGFISSHTMSSYKLSLLIKVWERSRGFRTRHDMLP